MSKTNETRRRAAEPTPEVPTGWRTTAKIFWWLVLIAATAISVVGNLTHADAVAPEQFRLLARVIGGGSPIALLVMIEGAELGLLARAHGAARTIGLALLVPLSLIVFATSYAGLLYVVTESGLAQTDALRWSLAAVPDLLMITATVYLIALRSTGEPSSKSTSESPWRRALQAAGEGIAARAEAAADRQNRAAGPSDRRDDPASKPLAVPPVPDGGDGIGAGQGADPARKSRTGPVVGTAGPPMTTGSSGSTDPLIPEAEGIKESLRMRLATGSVAEILRQLDGGAEPVEVARALRIDPKTVRKVAGARHHERRLTSVS